MNKKHGLLIAILVVIVLCMFIAGTAIYLLVRSTSPYPGEVISSKTADNASILVGLDGTIYLLWTDDHLNSEGNAFLQTKSSNGKWGNPQIIDSTITTSSYPALFWGGAHQLCYYYFAQPGQDNLNATCRELTGWTTYKSIGNLPYRDATQNHKSFLWQNGHLLTVFETPHFTGPRNSIWDENGEITTDSNNSYQQPSIAIDTTGITHLWYHVNPLDFTEQRIEEKRSADFGKTWLSAEIIDTSEYTLNPQIISGSDGYLYGFYQTKDSLCLRRYGTQSTWETWKIPNNSFLPDIGIITSAVLAQDSSGTLHLVFENRAGIYVTHFSWKGKIASPDLFWQNPNWYLYVYSQNLAVSPSGQEFIFARSRPVDLSSSRQDAIWLNLSNK
jgi:hypothetical protein